MFARAEPASPARRLRGAYSSKYTAAPIPTGKESAAVSTASHSVPAIAGPTPAREANREGAPARKPTSTTPSA